MKGSSWIKGFLPPHSIYRHWCAPSNRKANTDGIFLLLFPGLNLGKKTNNKHSVDKHPPDICRAAIDVDVFVVELPGVYVFVFNNNTTPTNRFVSLPVLSCFPLPPEERRSTEVRSIACDDVPVCVASLLFVCFNSIGSSQVLEVFVLFVGKGLNQKFTAPIPLPNFLFSLPHDCVTLLLHCSSPTKTLFFAVVFWL